MLVAMTEQSYMVLGERPVKGALRPSVSRTLQEDGGGGGGRIERNLQIELKTRLASPPTLVYNSDEL